MNRWLLAGLCLIVGLLHGLPHILIPLHLSAGERYTPFAVNGVSALTFDESYIYAAQANYTATRWKPAYDTDVYEYRDVPAVFPYMPFYALAALARLTGGTANAFIVCDFILPALGLLLAWLLITGCTGSESLGALGALATILISFGPRNFFTLGKDAIQPLDYSRLLHPELSFTLFLLAIWLLWRSLKRPATHLCWWSTAWPAACSSTLMPTTGRRGLARVRCCCPLCGLAAVDLTCGRGCCRQLLLAECDRGRAIPELRLAHRAVRNRVRARSVSLEKSYSRRR